MTLCHRLSAASAPRPPAPPGLEALVPAEITSLTLRDRAAQGCAGPSTWRRQPSVLTPTAMVTVTDMMRPFWCTWTPPKTARRIRDGWCSKVPGGPLAAFCLLVSSGVSGCGGCWGSAGNACSLWRQITDRVHEIVRLARASTKARRQQILAACVKPWPGEHSNSAQATTRLA
jgi:hypothetical protein